MKARVKVDRELVSLRSFWMSRLNVSYTERGGGVAVKIPKKKKSFPSETLGSGIRGSSSSSLGTLPRHSGLRFPHLLSGNNTKSLPLGLLRRLNMHYIASNTVNIQYVRYYFFIIINQSQGWVRDKGRRRGRIHIWENRQWKEAPHSLQKVCFASVLSPWLAKLHPNAENIESQLGTCLFLGQAWGQGLTLIFMEQVTQPNP